ncbi:MAG: STAS domain-containing protein [Candidatus Omnitrophica bacterium]|nr:STAS domain-containing protein [Candidatus Omnitrophota bacterium]
MELNVRKIGNVTIVDVKEDVTNELGSEFREQIDKITSDMPIRNMIFNLEGVDYICSTGFGVMAVALKKMRSRKGDARFLHFSGEVKKLFEITRLTKIIKVFDNEGEALRSFQ